MKCREVVEKIGKHQVICSINEKKKLNLREEDFQ